MKACFFCVVVCCFLFTSLLDNMLLYVWLCLRRRQRRMKYTEVQSSGRWLWASVSLSHLAFASPAARVCFSVTAHISFFWLPRVNEPDKKLDYSRAFFWLNTIQRVILSSLSPVYPIFFALSWWSLRPLCLRVWSSGEARGDGAKEWMTGWWVDKQETLVSNYYDGGESYDWCGVLPEGGLMCPDVPITQLGPFSADGGGAFVTFMSGCEEEHPSGPCWG